jgi:hypothetical protein
MMFTLPLCIGHFDVARRGEFSEHGGRLVNFRGFIGFDAGG